jgi:hypothetical protein
MTERLMVKPSFKKPEDESKENDKKDEVENNKE